MPYSNFGYLDPIHIVWREGTENDPYIDRIEYLKVLNHKIVLSEIPDKFTRVKIAGMIEINYEGTPQKSIRENEFSVNYSTGVIQFHASKESDSVNVMYKGKGFIQYPSSRIYHQDELNDVVESLEQIINNSKKIIKDTQDKIKNYEDMVDIINSRIVSADTAISAARDATTEAEIATDKALDAYHTTRLVFLPYVNEFTEIRTKYPNPQVGWTVQVYKTGVRYRYDGIEWIPIDLFGGGIPLANENFDGLLSKEDFRRLRKFDEKTYAKRTIVFVMPSYQTDGIQNIIVPFPYKGIILNAKAVCGEYDQDETEIAVEKSRDMENWTQITSRNTIIRANKYFDDGGTAFNDANVREGDLFRLVIVRHGSETQHITYEITIETIL